MTQGRRSQRGFTLLEVMIVVAVVAILALILIPNFSNARAEAQVSACESNLRSIATALELYYADNQQYPAAASATDIDATFIGATGPLGANQTYLNNVPSDPAPPAGTDVYYSYLNTTSSTTGVQSYTVQCPGKHQDSALTRIPGHTTGHTGIEYLSGQGISTF